ncbi:MAG: hypothetical protein GHHEDOFH_00862 [Pseudorhodoplanes sp.]|nr:hypothetical protein [Pseudorhodoplanes sp.]
MWALPRLAWAEFWKGFRWNVGTPAARDFLWLFLFFALSSFLVFLGWSARQGIWERFEQVLLGALPNSGPPIRVSYHIDRPEKITAQLVDSFKRDFPKLSIVPMRDFDGQSGTIVFPGLAIEDEPIDQSAALTPRPTTPVRDVAKEADTNLSWGKSRDGSDVAFRAYALPLDAPIWRWVTDRYRTRSAALDEPGPMVVAASRTLFSQHFRYDRYRSAVVNNQRIPCVLRSGLPDRLTSADDLTELKSLVLEVKEGFNRTAFHSFQVIWVDSFPMSEQVALILPLPTVEILMAAEERQTLDLHLESHGKSSRRVQKIWLPDIDNDPSGVTEFRRMAACLGAIPAADSSAKLACGVVFGSDTRQANSGDVMPPPDARIIPRLEESSFELAITASKTWPLRENDILHCARRAGLGEALGPAALRGGPLKLEWTEPPTPIVEWRDLSRVSVPCEVLIAEDKISGKLNENCKTSQNPNLGTAWLPGYRDAMIYVPASGPALDDVVQRLLAWTPGERPRPVFRLDPAYESALVRFGVLSTLIDLISTPLAIGLALLYLALASVILVTAFQHRRAQYGLLAMNGVLPAQILYVVCIQITLGYVIGSAVGYLGFAIAIWGVNDWLVGSEIIAKAAAIIGLDIPRFLSPLSALEILSIAGLMTFASLAIGSIILRLQGITGAKAPIELIKS